MIKLFILKKGLSLLLLYESLIFRIIYIRERLVCTLMVMC